MGSCAALGTAGCRQPDPDDAGSESEAPTESTVPLRLLVIGDQATADMIARGWQSVSATPIRSEVVSHTRGAAPALDEIISAAKKADLILAPAIFTPDLLAGGRIKPLKGKAFEQMGEAGLPSLDLSLGRFADEHYALPIGAKKPALLSGDPIETPPNWEAYDSAVANTFGGNAAEPTAKGWAGWMFLMRLARKSNRWLFNRETFAAGIAHPENVRSLELMQKTVARYPDADLTPGQIYDRVAAGDLAGGIGFPSAGLSSQADLLQVTSLPVLESIVRELIDPYSPVLLWSSQCRQTAVARTFCGWIAGPEGARQLGQTYPEFSATRRDVALSVDGVYDRWLVQQYDTPLTLPTLRIHRGYEYYAALDQAIIGCVRGTESPESALKGVAETWNEITEEVSSDTQLRAWRQNQGLKA